MSGKYLPTGWDAGWNAALAAIGGTPATVAVIGDSVLNGGSASNNNVTGIRALLRTQLIGKHGLFADYFPNYQNSFPGWGGGGGGNANFFWGFAELTVPNGSGGTNTLKFTSPYPCTQMDIIYFDSFAGTWSYNLDGAGNTIVTNQNVPTGSSGSYCIKRLSLTGLRGDLTHSLVFASQSASDTCAILGVICYPNGLLGSGAGGGIAYAPHTYTGTLLTDKIRSYSTNAGTPTDMCWLMQGASPLCYDPGTPSTQVTAGAPTTGGSVDVGTHYYGYTYVGGFGETSIGTTTSAAVTTTSGTQTVPLTTIANSAQQSDCPYNASANKNLYRTKASGTGTPGSSTNPWFLLSAIANGTTTYTDTTADASLTNQQPPATQFTYTPSGAFGFPCQPNLAIIGMGANDINTAYSATNVSNFELTLRRLCKHIRRGAPAGAPPPSIIIFGCWVPDALSGDGGNWAPGNNVDWIQYLDMMYAVAQRENCAFLNMNARWGEHAVALGYGNGSDLHPTDAGNADELAALQELLWL